ncbi:MBL fold metallo-hydrolase [Variovorax saccharolyticus]|uniref:MBL fold metallo-hydrolase n=1 Tax=Variovorax saccharolyticus TaxID=3053516 RepID=UPI0025758C7C|nr:MBL fold metallo-hydrolase [Variovorax sp. J31P216]MDM0028678.1 MBL fold metallo-hydrolase [Variovorax sp. J31P216]
MTASTSHANISIGADSVSTFTNGKWRQNCYVVGNADRKALIVDPGSDAEGLIALIDTLGVTPVAIVNTHAHYDHIGAVAALQEKFSIPFYLHGDDAKLMKQANIYKILFESKASIKVPEFDRDLAELEGDELVLDGFVVRVVGTPGHTPGSTCLIVGNNLFSGDTLLPGAAGRTDLPGGDKKKLVLTLERLRQLDAGYLVHPGHGKPFALGEFWSKFDDK